LKLDVFSIDLFITSWLVSSAAGIKQASHCSQPSKELVGHEYYTPGMAMIAVIRKMYEEGVVAGELRPYTMQVLLAMLHGLVNGALSAWANTPTKRNERIAVAASKDIAQVIGRF
jgi:hypothetical protein